MSRGTILLNEEKYLFSQKTLIGGNGAFIASFKNSNEFFRFFFSFLFTYHYMKKNIYIKYLNELYEIFRVPNYYFCYLCLLEQPFKNIVFISSEKEIFPCIFSVSLSSVGKIVQRNKI